MNPTELRDQLIRWSNQNSGSENHAGLAAMLALLETDFAILPGVALERIACVGTPAQALRGRFQPSAPTQILLSGHYDTVYGAANPFQHCELVDAHTLRGPGVTDMKGGLVVMLAALDEYLRANPSPGLGFEILITPDEETGSFGSAALLAAAAPRHHLGLVFEPARPNGSLVQSRKGTGNFIATCRGRAGHAAKVPSDARNAIAALAEFVVAAHRLPAEMPGILLNVGLIRGGGEATNVVPDFAQAILDVRITRAADRDAVLARLDEIAASINAREGLRLEITGSFNRPPKECGPVEEAAFAVYQQCGNELGLAPFGWVHAGGGSDGNLLSAAGLPNLDGLGAIGDHLHSDREYCLLPSLMERAQLCARFLQRIAEGNVLKK
ncbi:MAG: peptidase [Verrucomicrobia bacterium]|nr:peptidase [Verrucomicrobiota bacterium]